MGTQRAEAEERRYTIEEYARLPEQDGYSDELVRGRVVREPVGGEHGRLQLDIGGPLRHYVKQHGLGVVLVETGFILSEDPPTVRAPDVSFITAGRLPPEGVPRGFSPVPPDLAVEVVSPSNTAAEIQAKVAEYLAATVRLVWVVDPARRHAVVYDTDGDIRILTDAEALDGGNVVPGFQLSLAEVLDG